MHRVWAEIDTAAVRHNLAAIRQRVGDTRVMAVLKANAYGHGAVEMAKLLAEEPDANKLAAGVARLASASVQLLKIGQARTDDDGESLASVIDQILIDLEREEREAREAWQAGVAGSNVQGPVRGCSDAGPVGSG